MRVVTVAAIAALLVAPGCGDKQRGGDKDPGEPAPAADDAGAGDALARTAVSSVEVKVVDPTTGPAREVYPRELAKRIGATLSESEWFVAEDGEPPAGVATRRAVIEVLIGYSTVPEGSTGQPAVIAVVEAKVDFRDGAGGLTPAMNLLAERPYSKDEQGALDGVVAEHVERAVVDAAAGLIAKERVRVGPPAEAIAALDSDDVDVQVWALAVIGNRGIGDAADAVISLLASEDEQVRDAAIGALVALEHPDAVSAITRLADFQDYALMRRVIDAVGILGGDEAIDYLEFVASGHPDDAIKNQAAGALRRLQRRRAREAGGP